MNTFGRSENEKIVHEIKHLKISIFFLKDENCFKRTEQLRLQHVIEIVRLS